MTVLHIEIRGKPVILRSLVKRMSQLYDYFSSLISSRAARTAEITKAEKVQFFPLIASSTSVTTSFGNLIVLFVVGGIDGILKVDKINHHALQLYYL